MNISRPEGDSDVNLLNCDSEPIHILGAIQPFGFLLAVSDDWQIMRASENVEIFFGRTASSLLGQPLSQVFTEVAVHNIRNRLMHLQGSNATERLFGERIFEADERAFDLVMHYVVGQLVVEVEPAQAEQRNVADTIRSMISRLDGPDTLESFFREGARQVRLLTGFDRVMVYRFDDQGAGEVVAECAKQGIDSFLGLHYPASDIPAQARVLYLRNLFRVIADVAAAPVPIVPQLDESGAPFDLSLAVSRAVSPIHLEYLSNMGVAASLSISIVVEGELWGLFACHHYQVNLPSLESRSLAELFGRVFAAKLESRERKLSAELSIKALSAADALLRSLAVNHAWQHEPAWLGKNISQAIDSDGIGVSINGLVALAGLTPTEPVFIDIVRALNNSASSQVFATKSIQSFLPNAGSELAAGMLVMPISRSPRDYIVFFRKEYIRTVQWAGDPTKSLDFGAHGARLTPRKSFEIWSELARGQCKPFNRSEINVAEMLRSTLIEVILKLSEESHLERQTVGERQEVLIAELNHRVRNILTLVRALVQRSGGNALSIEDFVRETDCRINALARAHNQITHDQCGSASLRALIQTEVEAYFTSKVKHVVLEGCEILLLPLAFSIMAMVIHELTTNSAKYGALSDSGQVNVNWQLSAEGDLRLHWKEIGGPPVTPPNHQGFGSTIIRRSIPHDLGGTAALHYYAMGFEAEFLIPARFVSVAVAVASVEQSILSSPAAIPSTPLGGRNVLVVEDSLVIALFAEDCLLQLGAASVTTSANVSQALIEIDKQSPDLVLLDIHLGEENSFPLAEKLTAMHLPFIFTTGYGDRGSMPEAFKNARVLQKPYVRDAIALAVLDVLKT